MNAPLRSYAADWDMLQVNAKAFYSTSADLQVIRSLVNDHGKNGVDLNLSLTEDDAKVVASLAEQMAAEVANMGARVTLAAVNRLVEGALAGALSYHQVLALTADINSRIRDELDGRILFCLSELEAAFYNPSVALISREFAEHFPSAAYDVEEAGRCYALERYTASVFHATRILEFGIRAMARCLNIPDPLRPAERNWAIILKAIKTEIDARWTAAERMSGDGEFFEDLHATLDAVRNPMRNATMHPQRQYAENEAYDVVRSVGRFMRKLAERCNENGEPKARRRRKKDALAS